MARTQEILKKSGKPLHVNEILTLLGKGSDRKTKESLTGSLAAYARKGQVFQKVAPNTFGLVEMDSPTVKPVAETEPPADFGGFENTDTTTPVEDDDVPF
jgi:hypothetical protein